VEEDAVAEGRQVPGSRFRVPGLGFQDPGLRFQVADSEIQGSRFKVPGSRNLDVLCFSAVQYLPKSRQKVNLFRSIYNEEPET